MTNADQIAQNIYVREGMDVPADIGDGEGITGIGGQTTDWLTRWSLTAPSNRQQAEQNITAWLRLSALQVVVDRSLPLGDAVADYAYNDGERRAIGALQSALGVAVDGVLGPVTIGAMAGVDAASIARQVAKHRIEDLGVALASGQLKPTFASGELNRALLFL